MKIFISADLEGVNGVVSPEDVIPGLAGYETARILMTEEINAVVEGALEAGAKEVTVCDAHEIAQNVRFDLLDERAVLLRGETRANSMVHGLDHSFDGLILLGHHGMFGTKNAVLDHSYDQRLIRMIKLNGIPYGEVGINAFYAAEQGVPFIMASGDDALCREARDFYKDVELAMVKKAEGRYCARCLPKKSALELLKETAKGAVSRISSKKCVVPPRDPSLEITFQQTCMADGAMRVKGARQIDSMTISYRCSSMKELMEMRQVIFQAAAEFYDSRF